MTIIEESLTAKGYTPAALVPAAFGTRRTIDEIVIHHWGDRGQTHDGVVNFFVNGPGQTSAHYVASAGRIHCLVSPEDAAWHCPGKNASTIGIECRPEATDADYATVAELIRTLRAQYGNLPLSKHRDWYATACPGVWDLTRLDALAGAITLTTQSETITPLEDDLSAADVDAIITETNKQKEDLKKQVFERINEAVLNLRQNIADTAGVDRAYLADRIKEQSPKELAVQINAAGLAAQVRDELVKLIGGK